MSDDTLLMVISLGSVFGGVLAIVFGVWAFLTWRNRKLSAFHAPAHARRFASVAASLALRIDREVLVREARPRVARVTRAYLIVLAVFVAIPVGLLWSTCTPVARTHVVVFAGFVALLVAGGFAASRRTLRQLRRWPLEESISFISPSAGPVVLSPQRLFVGGTVVNCRDLYFVRDPEGRGVRVVRYEGGTAHSRTRRREALLFDWPPSLPARSRDAIAHLLVDASAPELGIGVRAN